jgi:hypothetical protein
MTESREKKEAAENPPEADPDENAGTSAAEEGIHPASPETYSDDPEAPTHSTED